MDIALNIGNKKLNCSLGLGFLGELLDATDMGIEEIGEKMQKNPFKLIPLMIYNSAKYAAELDGKEFDMTLRDVVQLLDANGGLGNKEVVRFIQKWTESMTKDVPDEEAVEDSKDVKKKLTGQPM